MIAFTKDAFSFNARFNCFKYGGRRAEVAEIRVGDSILVLGIRSLLGIDGDEALAAGESQAA